jgi:hypothetical protein
VKKKPMNNEPGATIQQWNFKPGATILLVTLRALEMINYWTYCQF